MEDARRSRRGILAATGLAAVVALVAAVSAGADSGSAGASAGPGWSTQPVQQNDSAPDDPRGRGFDCPARDGGGDDRSRGGQSQDAAPSPTAEV